MNREQAINYLICRGLTQEQVGDVVRALTYKPRDCANCKHYVVKDTRTNWGSQETTKIYGCECWECEYEPTTKNNLAGDIMDFPKTFDEFANFYGFKDKDEVYTNGSELIPVFRVKQWLEHISTTKNNLGVEEVTALAEWTEKLTKASEEAYNKGFADGANEVLDKLRAEIEAEPYVSKMEVLDIIDEYKAESERQRNEDNCY